MVFGMHNLNKKTVTFQWCQVLSINSTNQYQLVSFEKVNIWSFPIAVVLLQKVSKMNGFKTKTHQIHFSPGSNQYIVACNVEPLFLRKSRRFLGSLRSLLYLPINRVLNRLSDPEVPQGIANQLYGRVPGDSWVPYLGWMNMWQMFTDVYPNWLSWCSWWDV